ncbi:MAG: flagellar hook-basal body complex protein FliE [Actinomycetota bacterium]|nr:flagellar hook-basal body complex protein FliE [Actinomycetota bacterium]
MIEPIVLPLLGTVGTEGPVTGLAPAENAALGRTAGTPDFAAVLAGGLEQVQSLHDKADGMAVQAATGDLRDVHDFMIATNEAALATEFTTAVRNKAVEAFTEIMRMQV